MKKLFFFKSSSSSGGNDNLVPPSPPDKRLSWDNPAENTNRASDKSQSNSRSSKGLFSKSRKQVSDSQISDTNSGLRRSRSYSSSPFNGGGVGPMNLSSVSDPSRSPSTSSTSGFPSQHSDYSARRRSLTPDRQSKPKRYDMVSTKNTNGFEKHRSSCSSASSSFCSTSVSNNVLDRYIDGENNQQEKNWPKSSGRRPPRAQYTAPMSPTDSIKERGGSVSYSREMEGTHYQLPSKDWASNGFGHESPRQLAKNVIERLSQSHVPNTSSNDFEHNNPISVSDVYDGSYNRCIVSNEATNFNEIDDDVDMELRRKCTEAEERMLLFSEEMERENFVQDYEPNVQGLVQKIRHLIEERFRMAVEVSACLQNRVSEREFFKKELKLAKVELDDQTHRLQKEKNELQRALEKELDRRSSDWSLKLEKYKSEEHKLRERVREFAELNVALNREVASLKEQETESHTILTQTEMKLNEMNVRIDEVIDENRNLRKCLDDLQDKYGAAEEDRVCMQKRYEEREMECKDLHKVVTRLLKTCGEQEKTIDGLRQAITSDFEKKHVGKLHMEQARLTGVEMELRKEIESYRAEVESLRRDNIEILNLKKAGGGNEGSFSNLKLDREIFARVSCLQNEGLLLVKESARLGSSLLEFVKGKPGCIKDGLDRQFVEESDAKLQGFKRKTETLSRNLDRISDVLQEKHNPDALYQPKEQTPEDLMRFDLRAEALLTSLLREKLYSKEVEIEQLQAQLATAARGEDILKSEVQNTQVSLSSVTCNLQELERQAVKRDEKMNRMESELRECTNELKIAREVVTKLSDERDSLWKEVNQYEEKNEMLNSEVYTLKQKIDAMEEAILMKEGQITILKDTLNSSRSRILEY